MQIIPVYYSDLEIMSAEAAVMMGYIKDEAGRRWQILDMETKGFKLCTEEQKNSLRDMNSGWYEFTIEEIQKYTGITPSKQRRRLKELTEIGVVETKVRGMPARRWIRILTSK